MQSFVKIWMEIFWKVLLGLSVLTAAGDFFALPLLLIKILAWSQVLCAFLTLLAINYVLWKEGIASKYYKETLKVFPGIAVLVAIFWGITLLFPHTPISFFSFALGVLFMTFILLVIKMFMQAYSMSKIANKLKIWVGRLYYDKYVYGLTFFDFSDLAEVEKAEKQGKLRKK